MHVVAHLRLVEWRRYFVISVWDLTKHGRAHFSDICIPLEKLLKRYDGLVPFIGVDAPLVMMSDTPANP